MSFIYLFSSSYFLFEISQIFFSSRNKSNEGHKNSEFLLLIDSGNKCLNMVAEKLKLPTRSQPHIYIYHTAHVTRASPIQELRKRSMHLICVGPCCLLCWSMAQITTTNYIWVPAVIRLPLMTSSRHRGTPLAIATLFYLFGQFYPCNFQLQTIQGHPLIYAK